MILVLVVAAMVCAALWWPSEQDESISTGESELVRVADEAPVEPVVSVYWTTPGLEPDTCVAGWLLSRWVSPGAKVFVLDESVEGRPFDVPGAELSRQPGESVSDLVMQRFEIGDSFAQQVVSVARELELNPWTTNDDPLFMAVRLGLADVLNEETSDQERMDRSLAFLDELQTSHNTSASDGK